MPAAMIPKKIQIGIFSSLVVRFDAITGQNASIKA